MSNPEPIVSRVRTAVAETLDMGPEEAQPAQRFFSDLGAESIDWLDLTFRVEREFKVRLPGLGEFEGVPTNADGRFTPAGLEALGDFLPRSLLDRFRDQARVPTAHELAAEITVNDIAGMVALSLESARALRSP
jgi:acyl carrier protein